MVQHYLELLGETICRYWDKPALTDYKGTTSYTYGEMAREIARVGAMYDALGLEKGSHIAICGNNCANWAVSYLATAVWGGVNVCIMPDFPADDIARMVNHSDAVVLIASAQVRKKLGDKELPAVQVILPMEELSVQGAKSPAYTAPTPESINYSGRGIDETCMICYTSGSTGTPKGVMLSFRSLSNNVQNCKENLPKHDGMNVLSMLPLAHMYGLVCELLAQLPAGCHIYFLGKTPTPSILAKALQEVQPYTIVTIPMVIEKICKKSVFPVINKPAIRFFWRWPGVGRMLKNLVCKKMLKQLGGNILQFHIGGAALNEDVEKLLMDIRFPVTVGYGLTETGPLVSGNLWQNFRARSGGKVVSGMEAKIVDEEIWVKGENVMQGYYKAPDLTAEVITEEGWFRTGDVGKVEKDGTIYVQGHKSNLIVQANGNKVYPEAIEALLNDLDGVEESLVTEWDNQLVALVVTKWEQLNVASLREKINSLLPKDSQLQKIETQSDPLEHTPKHSIKRYLYRKRAEWEARQAQVKGEK